MADRENVAPSDDKDGDEKVKEPAIDPMKGLKRANKTLQGERDALAKKIADMEAEAAKAKMTVEEKVKTDFAKIEKERDVAKAEAEQARKERENERRISHMVAKHGLKDPDFGELVLKKFNPEEHDDFDAFVTIQKKGDKFKDLFSTVKAVEEERVVDEETGEDIEPAPPKGKAPPKNAGTKSNQAADEEFARERWPNDPEKQKAYVANVNSLSRGGSR